MSEISEGDKFHIRQKQALKFMELAELKIKELTHEHTVIDQMMSAGSCGDCDVKYELQTLIKQSMIVEGEKN